MKLLKIHVFRIVLIFFPFFLSNLTIQAQTHSDTTNTSTKLHIDDSKEVMKSPKELLNEFLTMESGKKGSDSENAYPQGKYANDDRLDSIQLEAWKNYYGYMSKGYIHRSNVFSWQLLSSIIIFCVVILLVFAGIYFAWLQFKYALKSKAGSTEMLSTELSASMKEIKVSSPVLGVIILVISLFFFYLYLVYVYPIQDIF